MQTSKQKIVEKEDHAASFNNALSAALLEKGNLQGILDGNNLRKEDLESAMENFVRQIKSSIGGSQPSEQIVSEPHSQPIQ